MSKDNDVRIDMAQIDIGLQSLRRKLDVQVDKLAEVQAELWNLAGGRIPSEGVNNTLMSLHAKIGEVVYDLMKKP